MFNQKALKNKYFYSFGCLFYKKNGKRAGYAPRKGYSQIYFDDDLHYAHRLIYLYHHGNMPKQIDHADGDKANNKISNLRECDKSLNACNSKIRIDNQSGMKGVSWNKQRSLWRAYINAEGRRIELGHFACKSKAGDAVNAARTSLHGQFARSA